MKKLAVVGWILALGFSLTTWAVYGVIASGAKEVWVINEFDKGTQELNLEYDKPEKDDPQYVIKLIKCLGHTMGEEPQKMVVSDSDLTHSEVDPNIVYLGVDAEKGENPLQLKTVFFFTKWSSLVSAVCGAAVFLIWLLLLMVSKAKPKPAPETAGAPPQA